MNPLILLAGGLSPLLAAAALAAPPPTATASSPAGTPPANVSPTPPTPQVPPDLYDFGKSLFDAYAPPEVKAQYDFVSREQWDGLVAGLQSAVATGSFKDLAAYDQQVRDTVSALRSTPGYEDYADWLAGQLDEIEVAKEIVRQASPRPRPPSNGSKPPPIAPAPASSVPYYGLWLQRLRTRPPPARAAELMPGLKAAFVAEGLPSSLAWVAEVESGLNPNALSPAGARGLYQLMPTTAHDLGLSTFLPDERTDPAKSARASAEILRRLREKFGSWPLALAAYNVGEGRVNRALESRHATTFAEIADTLPAETRLYVPRVLATLTVREGVALDTLAAPTALPTTAGVKN